MGFFVCFVFFFVVSAAHTTKLSDLRQVRPDSVKEFAPVTPVKRDSFTVNQSVQDRCAQYESLAIWTGLKASAAYTTLNSWHFFLQDFYLDTADTGRELAW